MHYNIRKRRGNKNLKLSINSKGEIWVSSPWYIPNALISKFVQDNKLWIEEKISKIPFVVAGKYPDQEILTIFGKNYYINTPPDNSEGIVIKLPLKNRVKALNIALKEISRDYFSKRVAQLNRENFNFSYRKIFIRNQSTRWGSCSTSKNLNFNLRLALAPVEISDYVIIHELAHLKYPNHQADFWELVQSAYPNFKSARKWLKQNGNLLVI